jgi:hypothetical protein
VYVLVTKPQKMRVRWVWTLAAMVFVQAVERLAETEAENWNARRKEFAMVVWTSPQRLLLRRSAASSPKTFSPLPAF